MGELAKPIKCDKCGKEVLPNKLGVVTDYVWRDGKNLCFDCNKKTANGK